MKLIFCEKPAMGRDIAKILKITEVKDGYIEGKGYCVTWASGHFVGLASPEEYGYTSWSKVNLPMLPQQFKLSIVKVKNSQGKLSVDPFVKKQFKVIERLFKKCSEIIVATDAGREGELIFRNIYEYLDCKKPFKRLWTASLTDSAILKAFNELKDGKYFDPLYFSARARSQADWMVGINMTQALTIALNAAKGTSISAGRVQTPTLCLICKRFLDNKNFKKTPFWKFKLSTSKDGIDFTATSKDVYTDELKANNIFKQISAAGGKITEVIKIDSKESKENTPLLHDLASLQKKANVAYGFPMDKTQSIAQTLYEKKFITYPRTGSKFIPEDVFKLIPARLKDILTFQEFSQFSKTYNFSLLSKTSVNDTKVTDHHALLTTEFVPGTKDLTLNEQVIYTLIQTRMLESFSEVCIKNTTTVDLSYGIDFEAKGTVVNQLGWRAYEAVLEGKQAKDDEATGDEENAKLPPLVLNEMLEVKSFKLEQSFTKAKPLYTDATMLTAFENCGKEIEDKDVRKGLSEGIGTPATRKSIMALLYEKKLIVKNGQKIIPTELGLFVYGKVKDFVFADVEMTGKWENALTAIATGKLEENKFTDSIRQFTKDCTEDIFKLVKN